MRIQRVKTPFLQKKDIVDRIDTPCFNFNINQNDRKNNKLSDKKNDEIKEELRICEKKEISVPLFRMIIKQNEFLQEITEIHKKLKFNKFCQKLGWIEIENQKLKNIPHDDYDNDPSDDKKLVLVIEPYSDHFSFKKIKISEFLNIDVIFVDVKEYLAGIKLEDLRQDPELQFGGHKSFWSQDYINIPYEDKNNNLSQIFEDFLKDILNERDIEYSNTKTLSTNVSFFKSPDSKFKSHWLYQALKNLEPKEKHKFWILYSNGDKMANSVVRIYIKNKDYEDFIDSVQRILNLSKNEENIKENKINKKFSEIYEEKNNFAFPCKIFPNNEDNHKNSLIRRRVCSWNYEKPKQKQLKDYSSAKSIKNEKFNKKLDFSEKKIYKKNFKEENLTKKLNSFILDIYLIESNFPKKILESLQQYLEGSINTDVSLSLIN